MTLTLSKGGGATTINTQHNDFNYTKKRSRPVYNNSSSNKSISSGGVISSNSSNFFNNSVLVSFSSGDGAGSFLVKHGGSSMNISSNRTTDNIKSQRTPFSSSRATASSNAKITLNSTLASIKRKNGRRKKVSENGNQLKVRRRKPKLLKELTMFNRQNCLAKLLCGVQVAQPPTKSSSALNDYAYLVKAFFDRFS